MKCLGNGRPDIVAPGSGGTIGDDARWVWVEEGGKARKEVARPVQSQFKVRKGTEIEERGGLARNGERRGPRWNRESARCARTACVLDALMPDYGNIVRWSYVFITLR